MKARLFSYLSTMPVRELHLLIGGVALIVTVFWFVTLRPTFTQLQLLRTERVQLQQNVDSGKRSGEVNNWLATEVDRLTQNAIGTSERRTIEQLRLHLVQELNRISAQRRVALGGVTPGAEQKVMMFDEVPFDVDISGTYPNTVGWVRDVEAILPSISVIKLEILRNKDSQTLSTKARIAIYQKREGG